MMLSAASRNSKPLLAASCTAAAASITAALWKKDTKNDVVEDKSSSTILSQSQAQNWAGVIKHDVELKNRCYCEALKVPTINRKQTMIWLDDTSTKKSLESRYRVNWRRPLGEGGYGAVYSCTDRETGEKRALKMIPKAYTDGDSFQREIDALLRVRENGSHPNICQLQENFEKRGNYYLVMDLIAGGEMFDHLATSGAYSEADAARLVRETASALAFLHGIGLVHADLKPENLMLSTRKKTDSVIKVVDFGCSEVYKGNKNVNRKLIRDKTFTTQAYSPPEAFSKHKGPLQPSFDMWSMGCILYIMLVGRHPFDPQGIATDDEIEQAILKGPPPIRKSPYTNHLSNSAIDLLEKLMQTSPRNRMTALQMLEHPWVKGITAKTDKIKDSDEKLKAFRRYKSQLEVKIFCDWIADASSSVGKKVSLMEKAFRSFDTTGKGYLTTGDISRSLTGKKDEGNDTNEVVGLSSFSQILSDSFESRHYPEGYCIFKERSLGDSMYFINSGTVEMSTKAGFKTTLSQGSMFGESALLNNGNDYRSSTVTCKTPVHVIRISKEHYHKYMNAAGLGSDANLTLTEYDRRRKKAMALNVMRLQRKLVERNLNSGDVLFTKGEEGKSVYLIDEGNIKIMGEDVIIPPGECIGEHSLLTGLPRNGNAICDSDKCKLYEMKAREFSSLLKSSPEMSKSFRDICFRRDFENAIRSRFGKGFGRNEKELRQAFDSMDLDGSGGIGLDEIKVLFKLLYPMLPDEDPIYTQALQSLDLEDNGSISFDEFKKILLSS